MQALKGIHHVAIICSDYEASKIFYTEQLGLQVIRETYRPERKSYKLDLSLHGQYIIELFSFPDPPPRVTRPESAGLRHLAFEVEDIHAAIEDCRTKEIKAEPIRTDETTGRKFTFIFDPDRLPIELYES